MTTFLFSREVAMKIYDQKRLQDHYDMIFHKNQEKLLAGGIGDAWLQSPETDLYYYPESNFHLTVMDILGGRPNRQIPSELTEYIRKAERSDKFSELCEHPSKFWNSSCNFCGTGVS